MSSQKSQNRPNAKDILELEFFKMHLGTYNGRNNESKRLGKYHLVKNSDTKLAGVMIELRELKMKNETLSASNKHFNELLESKDGKFRLILNELDDYKLKFNRIKKEIENEAKNRNRISLDSQNSKYVSNGISNDSQGNRQNIGENYQKAKEKLKKNARIRFDLDKALETTKTIFDKQKEFLFGFPTVT